MKPVHLRQKTRDRLKTKRFIRNIRIPSAGVGRIGDLEKIEEKLMRVILKAPSGEVGKKGDREKIGERRQSWFTQGLSAEVG
jgi:hypothetical protein